ncbi:carbohydrate ABC transporter permease [Stackebrandtia nassauensis]|uniref:Binding-protein-dependent transport systems inner membrane component n=1 Tax=Stackebrandtia nassauensis (strain DSM 44728 / CIP 108903 / NRRL B-16338 / NBRC 102104 / LLR-40K-21) TaxID=446470 RepID=D3Q6Q0_STANL|nr:carbohydrate ABC transporter permease [Stackebrandtia nassauensis]ADD44293.1 binding-protein-dependent transport systems inner membrane component [Stackebrandtia nassauensis DSM 44728]
MSTNAKKAPDVEPVELAKRARSRFSRPWASITAIVIALLWTTPTAGLLISSFRPENEIKTTGWWTMFTGGNAQLTIANYNEVLYGASSSGQLAESFINSLIITVPSVLFPLALAALAAYALSWVQFKGRDWVFIAIFALQVVPLQMALIPLLSFFSEGASVSGTQLLPAWGLEGEWEFVQVWFAHTAFGLPLGIFLLHNFMSELPGSVIESARVDGASHGAIFRRIVLPLITPALASLAIFQFLWVWNDLLVALVFASDTPPLTAKLADMAGSRGNEWQRLTAGAFISIVIPIGVFLGLQRYFVRGLLAGSVKG